MLLIYKKNVITIEDSRTLRKFGTVIKNKIQGNTMNIEKNNLDLEFTDPVEITR